MKHSMALLLLIFCCQPAIGALERPKIGRRANQFDVESWKLEMKLAELDWDFQRRKGIEDLNRLRQQLQKLKRDAEEHRRRMEDAKRKMN